MLPRILSFIFPVDSCQKSSRDSLGMCYFLKTPTRDLSRNFLKISSRKSCRYSARDSYITTFSDSGWHSSMDYRRSSYRDTFQVSSLYSRRNFSDNSIMDKSKNYSTESETLPRNSYRSSFRKKSRFFSWNLYKSLARRFSKYFFRNYLRNKWTNCSNDALKKSLKYQRIFTEIVPKISQ